MSLMNDEGHYLKLDDRHCMIKIKQSPPGDYICAIEYKYEWEDVYKSTIEFFSWDGANITWFNDWWEGQEDVYVCELYSVSDLLCTYKKYKKIEGLDGWPEDCWEQTIKIIDAEGVDDI